MVKVKWHGQDYLHLKWHVVCCGLATPALFSGFLPLDISSPAVGDILRNGCCRCVCCRSSQRASAVNRPATSTPEDVTAGTKHRGERILKMEDAMISEEENTRQSDQYTYGPQPCSLELFNENIFLVNINYFLCNSQH